MSIDFKKDFKVEKEAGSQVKITGEIPYEEIAKHREAAIAALGKDLKVDGFRPGHVPENIVVEKVGEMTLLTEMAERALQNVYPQVVTAHKLDVIGSPQIQINKIAADNPLGFTATVATLPDITLPDYKKIAGEVNKEKEDTLVTDEDVDKQIEDILRQKAAYERMQKKAAKNAEKAEESKDGETELPTPEKEAEKAEEDKPIEDINELEIPELTDEVVKTLGQPGQFETVDDFKSKIREHLGIEKKREAEAKHRAKLTDKIVEESTLEIPQVLIESELHQMFAQMEEDIKRAGLSMEDYLSHVKKSMDDLKKEWTPAAEKRASLQLVLNEIAKAEKIEPDMEELEQQTKQLLEQHKGADESRVRVYVASVLTNEEVMKMLESQ